MSYEYECYDNLKRKVTMQAMMALWCIDWRRMMALRSGPSQHPVMLKWCQRSDLFILSGERRLANHADQYLVQQQGKQQLDRQHDHRNPEQAIGLSVTRSWSKAHSL